ncbi:MAG: SDR family oxidoreductase [Sphingomonadales bacterium]|nr:SDR family oxidoreductase [Sphingomonadales bacterium]
MDLGLAGKVVIVTGATANIGRGIALEFAREGAKVVIVGRDAAAGAKVVAKALALGAAAAVFAQADLLDPAAPAAILAAAAPLGPVDVLVNGLGGNVDQGLFADSDPAKWAGDIDLNFGTVLRMTHAVLPQMIERKAGAIVNIGSTAGLVGDLGLPVYSAMKGAVHSLTVVLAKELGKHNIRVNCVAPWATFARDPEAFSSGSRFNPETGFFVHNHIDLSDDEKALRQRPTFVGRPFATPEEVAALVVWVASTRASYTTGSVWSVDGGCLM